MFFRQFVDKIVNVPPSITMNISKDFSYNFVKSIFNNNYSEYVVQVLNSGGGEGSILFTENYDCSQLSKLKQPVLITPYIKNALPVNVHIAVSYDKVCVFPPSIQLISNKFNYSGSDFIKFAEIDENIKNKIYYDCLRLGKKIQSVGAVGIFGVDILVDANQIFVIECNFRYQGSSFVLNRALIDNEFPSLFDINYCSFYDGLKALPSDLFYLKANYSSFRRTITNKGVKLPSPTQIISDSNNLTNKLRGGYIHYELFNKSIYDFFEI
jgi:hypothetical protein